MTLGLPPHPGGGLCVVRKQIPPVPKERGSSKQLPAPLKAELITTSRWNSEGASIDGVLYLSSSFALDTHVFTSLVSLLLLSLQAYVNSHLSGRCLYSQDILLAVFCPLPCSQRYSQGHTVAILFENCQRNLHLHSVSGCADNLKTVDFTSKFIYRYTKHCLFPKSEECIPDKRPISVDLNSPSSAFF